MSQRVYIYYKKKEKFSNKINTKENNIRDIRREIDRLPSPYHNSIMNDRGTNLFETCVMINIICSIPVGSILIMAGALYSNFIIFFSGIVLLLEGIFAYALVCLIPPMVRNLKLVKISINKIYLFKSFSIFV